MAVNLPLSASEVDADFLAVVQYLTTTDMISRPLIPGAKSIAKRAHALTYTLLIWKFRLVELSPSASPFIEEIASDAIQFLPQLLMGYTRSTKLLLRGIIENALRFIYFKDHPVEFQIMNGEKKSYVSISDLFDYIKKHPNFQLSEQKFDSISRLKSLYDLLSSGLHGRTVVDFELRPSLESIKFEVASATLELNALRRCAEAVNFVIAIETRQQFRRFPARERSLILRTIDQKGRSTLNEFVGAMGVE